MIDWDLYLAHFLFSRNTKLSFSNCKFVFSRILHHCHHILPLLALFYDYSWKDFIFKMNIFRGYQGNGVFLLFSQKQSLKISRWTSMLWFEDWNTKTSSQNALLNPAHPFYTTSGDWVRVYYQWLPAFLGPAILPWGNLTLFASRMSLRWLFNGAVLCRVSLCCGGPHIVLIFLNFI